MAGEKLRRWLSRLRHFRSDADLTEEMRVHLEMEAADLLAPGVSADEARRRTRLKMGDTLVAIERVRDQEFITMIESWYREFLLGLRALRKNPVFCFTAIVTLALGIGANTAIFTLLYGLLLRSLPVRNPDQLARIGIVSSAGDQRAIMRGMPFRMVQQYGRQQHSFAGISSWGNWAITMPDNEGTLRYYLSGLVSGNGFQLLGVKPYLGRLIAPSDDVRGGPSYGWPVVLSYGFWSDRFGGDVHAIGRQIKLYNTLVTIVGVTPPDFEGVQPGIDLKLYFPLQFIAVLAGNDILNDPSVTGGPAVIGRLRPGVNLREAAAELKVYQKELFDQFIPPKSRHSPFYEKAALKLESGRTGLPTFFTAKYSEPLYLMQGLVGIVLLLCCVNVGGLMMSGVYARQHEFAVRTAIGAARWRLIRQYLTESFVIAIAGALLGGVAAWYGSEFLQSFQFFRDPNMGFGMAVRPDHTVFLITGVCAVITTLLFGTLPAWRAGHADPGSLLKSRTSAGGRRQIAGRAFVPAQVALSLVLVALAALLSQSIVRIRSERTGFELSHVTIQTPPFNNLPQKGDARLDIYQRMVGRIAQMPGIRAAAVTRLTPMTGVQSTARFQALSGGPNPPEDPNMAYNDVGPGYFQTMETKILAGREFRPNERRRDVCVLNQSAADYLFPHQQALGQYVRSDDTKEFPSGITCRVIGIAQDAKFANLTEPPPRTLYFPMTKEGLEQAYNLVFLINAQTKMDAIAGYRKALSEIAPSIPLVLFVTLQEQMDAALGTQRLITMMSNFFGGLALFLSAIGLYGLLSSSVAQRTGEIGVRIALGAQRGSVLRMILYDALRLLGVGILLGAVVLFVTVRFVQNMLYGVSAFDPVTLTATVAILVAVTLLAALLPAHRASTVDPIQALRAE